MINPQISIIIPVYNVEKYLSACIDSILEQTFKDYEIILVDDGSKDTSGKICDEYEQKYQFIKTIHKPNGGQGDARNVGLHSATGEYVFFMDSDDLLYSTKAFERISQESKTIPDVIFHKHIKWFEKDNTYSECNFNYQVPTENRPFSDVLCDLIDRNAYGNVGWNKVVRRELLTQNNIEFQTGISAEDNDWFYKVLLVMQSVALIDEVFYVYRQREGSVTRGKSEKLYENLMWIISKWSKIVEEKKEKEGVKVILHDLAFQYCVAIINYCQASEKCLPKDDLIKYKYLLQYGNNPRVKVFRRVAKLFGIKGLVAILSLYIKMKR